MFTARPEIRGTYGVASSTHWIASQLAMRMLELGGNAFDAAVAGGFALNVLQPHLNGPGGDLVGIIHHAGRAETRVLCGQGPAPQRATIAAFEDLGHAFVPGTGLLAAVVPGAFDAWMLLLRDYGTMSVAEALEPALDYAEHGIPVSPRLSATIEAATGMFRSYWPTSAAIYLPNGAAPAPGSIFVNRALAASWRRLLDEARAAGGDRVAQIEAARRAWAQGFVAEAVDSFFSANTVMDVSGSPNPGLLRGDDMARWSATFEDPVVLPYHGHRIAKAGPWSQGPVLLQSLAMLADDDIAALPPESAAFVHLVTEVMKLAYADREAYYSDPAFEAVPLDQLLSPAYAQARRREVSLDTASLAFRPGAIAGFEAVALSVDYEAACGRVAESGLLGRYGGGEPTFAKIDADWKINPAAIPQPLVGDTCALEVADRYGNMVAITPSGGWLQSSPVIPELGFPMGTRLQSTSLDPATLSALVPGKRPRTTLSPTMVFKDDRPVLALGTPGGDQQDQWQLIFLLRHLHHGLTLQQAIEAPSFHSEHWPNSFYPRHARRGRLVLGGRYAADVGEQLVRKGHDVQTGEPWTEGRLAAVGRSKGMLAAAASPRGMQNYAVGR